MAHLARRPRQQCGAAVKARKRKAPQRPCRNIRRRTADGRPVLARAAVPGAAAGGPAVAAQHGGVPEAGDFSWPVVPVVPGVHCMLQAAGPVAPGGWRKSAASAVAWKWACTRCGIVATNSTKLLAVLRTGCGEEAGSWEQRCHITELQGLRVRCTRCGTDRQRHVQLSSQRCPVRCLIRQATEVPAGTAVYAAWHGAIQAMHHRSRPAAGEVAVVAAGADAGAAVGAVAGPAAADPAIGELAVLLRPYRAHNLSRVAGCEFCHQCFGRPPRYKASEWRASRCDGEAPVGAAPKHLLAALYVHSQAGGQEGQVGRTARFEQLVAAAKSWHHSLAGKALRPPKRRAGPCHSLQADRARRSHGREQGNSGLTRKCFFVIFMGSLVSF